MARTIEEIYDNMVGALNSEAALSGLAPQADDAQTLLADVTTQSKVADHRLWMWVFAFFTWLMEVLFDETKAEVNVRAGRDYGHLRWWQQHLLKFQLGFALTFGDERIVYDDTESPAAIAARIIKYSVAVQAYDSTGPKVILKAAKDLAGEPDPLTGPELTSLTEYCEQTQCAGVRIELLSQAADYFMLLADVRYDALILAADGSLLADPGVFPVEDAIQAYLRSIPFNGQLSLTHLKDRVQEVPGVNDLVISSGMSKVGVNPWTLINRLYNTQAGFIRMSTTPGETLSDTLTYSPGL